MIFWGVASDASKAALFELPPEDTIFPPHEDPEPVIPTPSTTKSYAKPTVPPETTIDGTATPTAPPTSTSTSPANATSTPTMDEGWFSGMGNLVSNPKWFFGAIGAVAVFGLGAGIFFWRRRRAARTRSSDYSSLPGGDDVQMSAVGGGGGSKELYDAFGELSDDEDADEETHLRGGHSVSEGIGFHSGFLDDDEPGSAGGSGQRYRDEPAPESPGQSSGDGSWQHPERD